MNGVEVVVNEDVIALERMNRLLRREMRARGITTEGERDQLKSAIYLEFVRDLVTRQGGEDLGLDRKMVDRIVADWWKRRTEQEGGIRDMNEWLKERGVTATEQREEYADLVYRQQWQRVITGEDAGPGGRPVVDAYVRPSERLRRYESICRGARHLDEIGGEAPRYVLQELLIPTSNGAAVEAARATIEDLVRQVREEGEDFPTLVAEFGQRAGEGLSGRIPITEVDRRYGRELALFVERAAQGDLSPVLPIQREGQVAAWRVVRVNEIVPAQVPGFADPEVQERVWKLERRLRQQRLLDQALTERLRASYVWPRLGAGGPARPGDADAP